MTRLAGRLALVTAVVACAVGAFAVSAWARTTPAGGEAGAANVRTLAYNQPLNQSMNGVGAFDGCFAEVDGSITGQPIAAGGFSGIIVATGSCAGPAPCFDVFAFMILGDTSFGGGAMYKFETGKLCVVSSSSTGLRLRYTGRYEIVGGVYRFLNAAGTGNAEMSFDCDVSGSSCTVTGREWSGEEEHGPIKKGNDPAHVLLCSPTLVQRGDGTMGVALQVPWTDYQAWLSDPTTHPEIPAGSIPAKYAQDIGLTCDNLPGYVDSGKKVDEQGTLPDDQTGPLEGAIYPYWVKT